MSIPLGYSCIIKHSHENLSVERLLKRLSLQSKGHNYKKGYQQGSTEYIQYYLKDWEANPSTIVSTAIKMKTKVFLVLLR